MNRYCLTSLKKVSMAIENKTYRFVRRPASQDVKATFCKVMEMVLFCIVNIYFILLIIIYHTVHKRKKPKNLSIQLPFCLSRHCGNLGWGWEEYWIIISKANVISDGKQMILCVCVCVCVCVSMKIPRKFICPIFSIPESLNIFIHIM